MTTNLSDGLQSQIERLVREHLAAQQKAVTAAVERAFSSVATPVRSRPARSATGGRRRASELADLAERLCEAVRACPGETMTTIAERVGEPPRTLNRPMHHLKTTGRVRSAGARNLTRYFPMATAKTL